MYVGKIYKFHYRSPRLLHSLFRQDCHFCYLFAHLSHSAARFPQCIQCRLEHHCLPFPERFEHRKSSHGLRPGKQLSS